MDITKFLMKFKKQKVDLNTKKPIGPNTKEWFDDQSVDSLTKEAYLKDGVVILKNIFNDEQIKKYNKIINLERAGCDDGKNEYGFGDRIGQLHQKYPELLELANDKSINSFLNWAFNDTPVVFGSLNFERGTEQGIHKDGIFFLAEPCYSMAGVWIALEDINEDSGPLFYIPGSHKWPFFHPEDIISKYPEIKYLRKNYKNASAEEKLVIVANIGNLWTKALEAQEVKFNKKRECFNLKAGDVVIWHSLLAHGGSPVKNKSLSRKSVVFHFIGKNTKLYSNDQFMLFKQSELKFKPSQKIDLKKFGDLEYMHYGYYVTYPKSGEKIHLI
jgi:ectoine hydroxylase-related dioxygenase (phytanoyl-CoA dioxygenase family)